MPTILARLPLARHGALAALIFVICVITACEKNLGEVHCQDARNFVGKRIAVNGTMAGFTFNADAGKSQMVGRYTCKSSDGAASSGVQVFFDEQKADWTRVPGKTNLEKTLLRISGIVRASNTEVFLDKVVVDIAGRAAK